MALWKVFIDDSADQHREKYVVAGALIGNLKTWQQFQRKWNRTLRDHPRINYFHGKELRTLKGEFLQFRDEQLWPKPSGSIAANAKRDALYALIEQSGLIGCGVGVGIQDYERIRASHRRGKTFMAKDAFEYVLQATIYEITKTIKENDPVAQVAFVSDDSNRAKTYAEVYTKWKNANPISARSMLGISHLDDKKWPGLQAADMGAASVKMVFEEYFSTGKKEMNFPLASRFYRMANIDEGYILAMLDNQSVRESEHNTR
jgi:Protein of unknown function (DUF3800)